jgi:hypothetical protein
MIALTDSELHEVRQAAQTVPYDLRQVFLERLALELRGKDLGPRPRASHRFRGSAHDHMGRGAGGELGALDMPNPYSRAE